MSESTNPSMSRDNDGTVVHNQLEAAQDRVENLGQKLETAEARTAELNCEVRAKQGMIQGLQTSIQGGDISAADTHSQASAELNALQRDLYNHDQARLSLRAQLTDARIELELNTAIYGHTDIINEQDRAVELAEAQMKARAILEPVIRKYRESDMAFYELADNYQRYLKKNPQGLQGVSKRGTIDRVDNLDFNDGTKLDGMGSHHAERVIERVLTNINADIKAEIQAKRDALGR